MVFRSKAIKKVRNALSFSQKSSEDKQSLFSRSRGSSLEEMFNNNSISRVNIVKIMGKLRGVNLNQGQTLSLRFLLAESHKV